MNLNQFNPFKKEAPKTPLTSYEKNAADIAERYRYTTMQKINDILHNIDQKLSVKNEMKRRYHPTSRYEMSMEDIVRIDAESENKQRDLISEIKKAILDREKYGPQIAYEKLSDREVGNLLANQEEKLNKMTQSALLLEDIKQGATRVGSSRIEGAINNQKVELKFDNGPYDQNIPYSGSVDEKSLSLDEVKQLVDGYKEVAGERTAAIHDYFINKNNETRSSN